MSSEDHVRAAWGAILRGDYAERDRQCGLGIEAIRSEERQARIDATARLMSVDFFVDSRGRAFPTKKMIATA